MKRGRELPKSHSCQISVLPDMAALRACLSMCMCANVLGDGFAIPEFCTQHFHVFLKCSCMLTYVPGNFVHAFVLLEYVCWYIHLCYIHMCVCARELCPYIFCLLHPPTS